MLIINDSATPLLGCQESGLNVYLTIVSPSLTRRHHN